MRIAQLTIKNFRGIAEAELRIPPHALLLGDNNCGKSSFSKPIDLVLGPDRLNRAGAIDEHDFYAGRYVDAEGNPVPIHIEAIIVDLNAEQVRRFKGNLEFWNDQSGDLCSRPSDRRDPRSPCQGSAARGSGFAAGMNWRTTISKRRPSLLAAAGTPANSLPFAPPTNAYADFCSCARCAPVRGP